MRTTPELTMFAGVFFLLLLTDGASSQGNCSYQDVLNHLGLTYDNKLFYMTRPVKNYTVATKINLDLLLYAILEMKEKEQIFVPYIWITMWWQNDYIGWDPEDFCGLKYLSVPSEMMWKPDLTIEETTERDKAPLNPYLTITSKGNVELVNDQVLVSTCRMQVYKFPFDTQSCDLTFRSAIHSDDEIKLIQFSDSLGTTEDSRKVMRTQSEWMFINITVATKTVGNLFFNQSKIIYTIHMKRRSALYVVNFILPILFLLFLDLAAFMIPDGGGEKLGFKVTVLLAVTVMQLILNEILPSSSNRIPLIAAYCIGVFALMMLSLLETVLVMYLIEKDSAPQDDETKADDTDQSLGDGHKEQQHSCKGGKKKRSQCVCGDSAGETPPELLKVGSSQWTVESCGNAKLSGVLREMMDMLKLLLDSKKEEGQPGYWTRKAKTINSVFFLFYVTAVGLFLTWLFFHWNTA